MGDILISLQNNTLSRADLSHEAGVAKNVHYGDVLIKFGEVLDISKEKLPMISDESVLSKYKASFLQNGDVIVADTAEDSTVGKCSEIAGLNDEVVLSGLHTIPYRPIEKFASGYLGYYLNSSAYHNQLLPLMQGIKVTSISKSAMQDTNIVYPKSVEEQGKIGDYFQSLDHLITLHQRILVKFAEKLASVWEQRKLNEIADKVSEKNKNNEFSEPFTNSAEQGIISQKDYFDREIVNNENLDGYYIVRNDDFIYNPRISVTAPVGPINRNRLGRNGVMSPLYTVFRTHDIDNLYLEFYFKTTKWHRFMKLNGDSGARFDRFTISSTQFMEMPIPYPTLDEQQKIGKYFDSLDHLITLHQRISLYFLKINTFVWEQRKLGDNIVEYTKKTTENNQYPVLTSSRKGIFFQTDYYDGNQIASVDNTGYNIVPYGYFTYRHMSDDEIFHFNINDITENGIVSTLYPVFTTDENLDSKYLQYQLNHGKEFAKYAILQKQGGSRTYMYLNKLRNLYLTVPTTIEEQKRISEYFTKLDHLITLHQRKCEETKILKKYMLQKMFPQNGQKVPEIRFKGFTEDWEQRKLKDVLERRIEQRQQSEEYPRLAFASGQGVIPLSERKTNNREQLTKDEYTKRYLVTELDDIVYNPANVKYGAIDRNKCGRGLISPIYVTFTTNEIPGFIERIVTSHDFQQRALRFEKGTVTKRQSVNPEDLVTLDILVSSEREEQLKIATYFDSFDHLITLHQRKCEELKNIKKFMLQNMFV